MNRKLIFILCLILESVLLSCASDSNFDGVATVSGIVVDESNNAVYGFPVTVEFKQKKYGTAFTNESGIFVIQNVPSGKIKFSAQREGYSILETEETFFQRDKIFCLQVSSVDAVLDKADEKILQEDFDGALEVLKSIYAKPNSVIFDVVQAYETALNGGEI